MAERVGFEPTDRCRSTVFETARFGHSRTSPYIGKLSVHRGGLILPEPLKEPLQKVATLVFQYAGRDGDLVIQAVESSWTVNRDPQAPALGSQVLKTKRGIRACSMAPAHMRQGSSVT